MKKPTKEPREIRDYADSFLEKNGSHTPDDLRAIASNMDAKGYTALVVTIYDDESTHTHFLRMETLAEADRRYKDNLAHWEADQERDKRYAAERRSRLIAEVRAMGLTVTE